MIHPPIGWVGETEVQALIDARANMEQSTETGSTALLVACRRGHRDITSFLMQAKANADWSLGANQMVKGRDVPYAIACSNHTLLPARS